MVIRCETRHFIIFLKLTKVLYAPDIPLNVISVSNLCHENSISVLFTNSNAIFYRSELVSPEADVVDNRSFRLTSIIDVPKTISDIPETEKSDLPEVTTDLDCSLNFSKPFFAVNRTSDNLYSFTLPIYHCSFNNISLFSSPIPNFNDNSPLNSCQAVLLKHHQPQLPTNIEKQDSTTTSIESLTVSTEILHPVFQTSTGKLKDRPSTTAQASPKTLIKEQKILLWHRRLAHAAVPVVREALHLHDPTFKFPSKFDLPFCDICVQSKLTHKTCDQIRTLPTRPAEYIAADIIGPISPKTFPHGYSFILTVIDVFSKFARVFLLKCKSETYLYLKIFFNMARAQHPTPGQFKFFRSDGGTEFTCTKVQTLLRKFGIEHQCSAPGLSSHNGSIERFNRTIQEKGRALLLQSGFPTTMWGLAVGAAEYIYNRTPHSAINMMTPYQKWTGSPPDLRHISIFGSLTYNLNSNRTSGKKFQGVSDPYFLAGFIETGYILYDPATRKTITASSVRVDESRQYQNMYPSETTPIPWSIPTSAPPPQQQQDTDIATQSDETSNIIQVEAQIHPELQPTLTDTVLPSIQEEVFETDISQEFSQGDTSQQSGMPPLSQVRKIRRRRGVRIRDAPLMGDEESSDSDSDTTVPPLICRKFRTDQ